MAHNAELAYTGLVDIQQELQSRFVVRATDSGMVHPTPVAAAATRARGNGRSNGAGKRNGATRTSRTKAAARG
jgi:hypothetical protein